VFDARICQAITNSENSMHSPRCDRNAPFWIRAPRRLIAASVEDPGDYRRLAQPIFGTFWSIRTVLRKALCTSATMNLFEKTQSHCQACSVATLVYRRREKLLAYGS
jgi:hypothetical protein